MYILLLLLLLLLVILYNVSTMVRYYLRMTFFYVCIFLHGVECHILLLPSYFQKAGADVIFHVFRYWCYWTGVSVEVHGFEEHLAHLEGPAVVVCNHQSALDVIVMTRVWPPRGVVMMKSSLKYIPFFNTASILASSIFINRFNKNEATSTVNQCVDQLLANNHKLWVFPEGTRNNKGGLLPFKKGAFNIAVKAQIPIIPIVTSHYESFYSPRDYKFTSDGEIVVEVLPPVSTEGLTSDDVVALSDSIWNEMSKVHQRITNVANVKTTTKRQKKAN